MKNFFKQIKEPKGLILMQIYSICIFVFFLMFIYFPYEKIDVDLFPFYIYKISWRSFLYFIVVYMCMWVFVLLRVHMLNPLKEKIVFKQLLWLDLLVSIFGFPLFFIYGYRIFGCVIIEFALLLLTIDLLIFSKPHLKFLYISIVLFVFINLVLLFVSWRNNVNRSYKATKMVEYCRLYDDWEYYDDSWSMAKYKDGKLINYTGDFSYPQFFDFDLKKEGLNHIEYRELDSHYLFKYGDCFYVVSSPAWHPLFSFGVNFTYIFTLNFLITLILYHIFSRFGVLFIRKRTFFTKLQYVLVIFMLVCMFVVLVLVSLYIGSKYERMSKNTQLYRTELFVNYMVPVFKIHKTEIPLQIKINRISDVLKTHVCIYDSNGERYIKSDNAEYYYKNVLTENEQPFNNMPSSIYVSMDRKEDNVYMHSYTILFDAENNPLYVILTTEVDEQIFNREISLFVVLVLNMYFLVMIVSIMMSYFISKRVAAPLRELEVKMRNVKFTGENEKIQYNYTEDDALSKLVAQYNVLLDQLKTAMEQLAENEREESWRNMARQIAHEIRNPLTPMRLLAQKMEYMDCENMDDYVHDVRYSSEVLLDCIDNVKSITDLLSDFARTSNSIQSQVNIVDKIKNVVALFQNNTKNVEVDFLPQCESVMISVDKDMITQLFNNLINNAIQSIPSDRKGKIEVILTRDEENCCIIVKDNGSGISKNNLDNIFRVSFTTKTKGMGLGLCVVKNVIESAHGSIRVESEENIGSRFIITFPIVHLKENV